MNLVRFPAAVVESVVPSRQIAIFCVVGSMAFVTHFCVVIALVPLHLAPLVANAVGFSCAFTISFLGHNRWTFPSTGERNRTRTLLRFTLVAIIGFAGNESLFWAMLTYTTLAYQASLLIVLGVVAVSTLLLSKFWAFADA